jgi:hypothetical protein
MMKDMVKYLGDKGLLVDDEGRKVLVVWASVGVPTFPLCASLRNSRSPVASLAHSY